MDGTSTAAVQIRHGLTYFQMVSGMWIQEKEPERKAVFSLLFEVNRMIADTLKGKIQNLFVSCKTTSLAFAEKVRTPS